MKYIDLNIVRAGVVRHPEEWEWCGHHELVGARRRYRLLDLDGVAKWQDGMRLKALAREAGIPYKRFSGGEDAF